MARLFDDASSQYLERTSAVLTATPITLAAWFYLDDAADPADFTILSLSASTGTEYWTTDVERSGGSAYVRAVAQSGATSDVSTRTTVSMNTWHHGAAGSSGPVSTITSPPDSSSASRSASRCRNSRHAVSTASSHRRPSSSPMPSTPDRIAPAIPTRTTLGTTTDTRSPPRTKAVQTAPPALSAALARA